MVTLIYLKYTNKYINIVNFWKPKGWNLEAGYFVILLNFLVPFLNPAEFNCFINHSTKSHSPDLHSRVHFAQPAGDSILSSYSWNSSCKSCVLKLYWELSLLFEDGFWIDFQRAREPTRPRRLLTEALEAMAVCGSSNSVLASRAASPFRSSRHCHSHFVLYPRSFFFFLFLCEWIASYFLLPARIYI